MEFAFYLPFLEKQFERLIKTYQLVFETPPNAYEAHLSNGRAKLQLFTFEREEGMGFVVIDPRNDKYYHLPDILQKKQIDSGKEYEQLEAAGLLDEEDEVKATIAYAAICLEKYCSDLLNGDFSVMGTSH
ncbi:hypothetical protein F0L74_11010 [Chitinophaga agrisoli]|uniref:Uncharacterized protein n=1 Tax=Chitinophaga agrisoli TaxID=2607653 RepID=A0A5B2VUX4_9BACT|nr:hypothetical protein [Chitinophaga agrisoli]KAA2243041.1 hypothetical protein F0L74_11010 [Chitinophaga agrisoli]